MTLEKQQQINKQQIQEVQIYLVVMYYPMRIARNNKYRLIHNLYYQTPYHIAGDLYLAATWQELLNSTLVDEDTH